MSVSSLEAESDPLQIAPHWWSKRARPLMPQPPIPTKWTIIPAKRRSGSCSRAWVGLAGMALMDTDSIDLNRLDAAGDNLSGGLLIPATFSRPKVLESPP